MQMRARVIACEKEAFAVAGEMMVPRQPAWQLTPTSEATAGITVSPRAYAASGRIGSMQADIHARRDFDAWSLHRGSPSG